MQTIAADETIHVPPEVAACPYCGGKLIAQPDHWEQAGDGRWLVVNAGIDCVNQPELDESGGCDTDEWWNWHARHSVMPYVYWLTVSERVTKWINETYIIEGVDS